MANEYYPFPSAGSLSHNENTITDVADRDHNENNLGLDTLVGDAIADIESENF